MSCSLLSVFEQLHCCLGMTRYDSLIKEIQVIKSKYTSYFCLKPTLPGNYQICIEHMACFSTVNL